MIYKIKEGGKMELKKHKLPDQSGEWELEQSFTNSKYEYVTYKKACKLPFRFQYGDAIHVASIFQKHYVCVTTDIDNDSIGMIDEYGNTECWQKSTVLNTMDKVWRKGELVYERKN